MTLESESAVLIDRVELSDDLDLSLNVANAIYTYEAINSTVQVNDLFKVSHPICQLLITTIEILSPDYVRRTNKNLALWTVSSRDRI